MEELDTHGNLLEELQGLLFIQWLDFMKPMCLDQAFEVAGVAVFQYQQQRLVWSRVPEGFMEAHDVRTARQAHVELDFRQATFPE